MPRKQKQESQEEQSDRFERHAQELIDAGELNPTVADEGLNDLLSKCSGKFPPPEVIR